MFDLTKKYHKSLQEESKLTKEKLAIQHVGKLDPKRHLKEDLTQLMTTNINQTLGTMMDTVMF